MTVVVTKICTEIFRVYIAVVQLEREIYHCLN